jgi:hypothetical protein
MNRAAIFRHPEDQLAWMRAISCEELIGCDPVAGCMYESVCSDPSFCDDSNVCTSDVCNPSALDCCDNTIIPCPPQACATNTGCHPTLGCQYVSVCVNPFFCNDNNVCTTTMRPGGRLL